MNEDPKRRRKRRTCVDRVRWEIRKQRRSDPASKTVLQLLGLFSTILALAPPMPEMTASGRDRRQPPSWYPNGPAAWARERGLEPNDDSEREQTQPSPALRPKPTVPWLSLVKDLERGPRRERAREIIETRVPPEALQWLRELIRQEDWLGLRLVGHDRTEEEIRERALRTAMRWEAKRLPPIPPRVPGTPDDTNDITPPEGPKPK